MHTYMTARMYTCRHTYTHKHTHKRMHTVQFAIWFSQPSKITFVFQTNRLSQHPVCASHYAFHSRDKTSPSSEMTMGIWLIKPSCLSIPASFVWIPLLCRFCLKSFRLNVPATNVNNGNIALGSLG